MKSIKEQIKYNYLNSKIDEWLNIYDLNHLEHSKREPNISKVSCLSYKQVVEKASVLAEELKKFCLHGNRIVLSMQPKESLYISHLACLLANLTPAIFHPPNHKQTSESFQIMCYQILASSQAEAILVDQYSVGLVQEVIKQIPASTKAPILLNFDSLKSDQSLFSEAKFNLQVLSEPTDIVFLQYSSGTTGAKKGVIFNHSQLSNHVKYLQKSLHINENDRIASWLPLYHDMGFIACWILPLLTGVSLSSISPHIWIKYPTSIFHIITLDNATLCWLPNFAFSLLTERVSNIELLNLTSLRLLISCSEFISYDVMKKFVLKFKETGLKIGSLSSSYAMAENIFAVTQHEPSKPLQIITLDERMLAEGIVKRSYYALPYSKTYVSSGISLDEIKLCIVNDNNQNVDEGIVGRIAYSSPTLFGGYLVPENEKLLQSYKVIHSETFGELYVTKDQGFIIDKHLFVLGRLDDVMIIGGKNIYPYDIESILNTDKALVPGRSVAITVKDKSHMTEKVVILAEVKSTGDKNNEVVIELKQKLTSTLDIPIHEILLIPHMSLSKSTSGKLSREINRRRYISGELDRLSLNKSALMQETSMDELHNQNNNTINKLTSIISSVINVPKNSLKINMRLFSTGLLDSFNSYLFFDQIRDQFNRVKTKNLEETCITLDRLDLIAQYLETNEDELESNTDIKSLIETKDYSKNQMDLEPFWYKYFTLHGTSDDKFHWFREAYKLSYFPNKKMIQGGGWLESPNVKTSSISIDQYGFRISLLGKYPLSYSKWNNAEYKGLLFGDSSIFGVGVKDDEVISSILHQLAPERLWLNFAIRGGSIEGIATLLSMLSHHQYANDVVIMGTGDFKCFGDQLTILGLESSEYERDKLWENFLKVYRQSLLKIYSITGDKLTLIHQPRVTHSKRIYQKDESDAFWRANAWLNDTLYYAYFGAHPYLEKYTEAFGYFLENLCRDHDINFYNYAEKSIFNCNEKLYHDTAHYTPLMHSLLAIQLNNDLNQ